MKSSLEITFTGSDDRIVTGYTSNTFFKKSLYKNFNFLKIKMEKSIRP